VVAFTTPSGATAGLGALAAGSPWTGSIVFVSAAGANFAAVVLAGAAPHPATHRIRNRVMQNEVNFFKV